MLDALCLVYLVAVMFSLGLDRVEETGKKKEKRRHLISGLVFNLVLVPVIALAVTRVARHASDVTSALLLLAAAPGGRYLPHLDRIAGGDTPLAIELTLFLAKLTAFTAPLTAAWLLDLHRVHIAELPFIAQLLLIQLAPLYAGKAVRRWRALLADRLTRPLRVFVDVSAAVLFAILAIGSGTRASALAGDRGWAAVGMVFLLAGGAGWLAGGPSKRTRRTFALSAGARNIALVLVIAGQAFPDSQVRLAAVVIWTAFLLLNGLFALIVGHRWPAVGAGRQARPV